MNKLRQKLIEFFNDKQAYYSTSVIAAKISGFAPEPRTPTKKVLAELKKMALDGVVEKAPIKHSSCHYWRVKS